MTFTPTPASQPIIKNQIADISVSINADNTEIDLLNKFDDPSTTGQAVRFEFYQPDLLAGGIIEVLLYDQADTGAPITVQNFLGYVNNNAYDDSFIHRAPPNFVIQGGSFTVTGEINNINEITTNSPIQNEYSNQRDNILGTIAMAKTPDNPNSATSGWFFNMDDNTEILNENQNGGFTTFGQVIDDDSLAVTQAIADLDIFFGSFSELPLLVESAVDFDSVDDYVRLTNITPFQIPELTFSVVNNSNPDLVNVSFNGQEMVLDYQNNTEGSSEITVEATNVFGQTIQDTFSVKVDNRFDENNPPTEVNFTNTITELEENTNINGRIKVADIAISDDGIGTNQLELTGADANSFEIRNNNQLFFIGDSPDFESKTAYQVTVNVDDNNVGNTPDASTNFTLNIIDVDENNPPTEVNLTNTITELAENTNINGGIKVADIAISDDGIGTNNLSLTGVDATEFEIRNSNQLLFIGDSPDFESKTAYQVTVNVDDDSVGNTPDASTNFTFNITDIADGVQVLNETLFRFQNSDRPGTFLFANEEESVSIRENFPNFIEEGPAFKVASEPGDDLIRFNRFQNSAVPGTYLYATEGESESIRQEFPQFIEEGIAFYAFDPNAEIGVDYYRMQNTQVPGTYIFVNQEERDQILANFPQFIDEGVAFEVTI